MIGHQGTRNTQHEALSYVLRFTLYALSLLLTACHPSPPADLTIINGSEPETLDPAIVTSVSDMRVAKALFEGLLRIDGKTGRPIHGWAEHWEIPPDGKVYTFHPRWGWEVRQHLPVDAGPASAAAIGC